MTDRIRELRDRQKQRSERIGHSWDARADEYDETEADLSAVLDDHERLQKNLRWACNELLMRTEVTTVIVVARGLLDSLTPQQELSDG